MEFKCRGVEPGFAPGGGRDQQGQGTDQQAVSDGSPGAAADHGECLLGTGTGGVLTPVAVTWPAGRLQVVEIVSVADAAHARGRPLARWRSHDPGGLPRGLLAGLGELAQYGGEQEVVWEVPADVGGGVAVDE